MAPLFDGNAGLVVLGVSLVLFVVGGFWMRVIVNVKV
jgi:Flp pilus assembly protein TadB